MNMPVYRLFIERKNGFDNEAKRILKELTNFVGVTKISGLRYANRYDIEASTIDGFDKERLDLAANRIFSEPQSDIVYYESIPIATDETAIVIEYVPGQYDQRADSAMQCLALIHSEGKNTEAIVRCARVFIIKGSLSPSDTQKIHSYLINPVDSRESKIEKPESLELMTGETQQVKKIDGFTKMDTNALINFGKSQGLAMDSDDLVFLQGYFLKEQRDPTETELKVLDTYWSDHCRHTTFTTILDSITIEEGPYAELFSQAVKTYTGLRAEVYAERAQKTSGTAYKPETLMDMAVIGAKALKKRGFLENIEESAEINACSIFIDVTIKDEKGAISGTEPWLLMFKNETHNHPTEIEPFGGAATCIGGAIRDPLSGRAWVYQALRVTGAGDPTTPIEATIEGKLPQIKLTREAAAGFSAYGNQIGLTTGQVVEYYDPGFLAKRMELGAVIAATPVHAVVREEPEPGDLVIMLGGGTGRDGIGGATGSSKVHTEESVSTAGAEVQKGNAVEERKIQRLFRNPEFTRLIRRCNDFGAGGVAVAVGELAPGLSINLDAVPKKYDGLNGTELAISESQERMAVVVRACDAQEFIAGCEKENLTASIIATVTKEDRLVMNWQGQTIVDIDRKFLDTAGAVKRSNVHIEQPSSLLEYPGRFSNATSLSNRWLETLSHLCVASQRGLQERFDGSIGSSAILFPMGGAFQGTPECGMASRIPVGPGKETSTVSLMTMGYDPKAAKWSPYHGAQYAVLESLAKILALGGDPRTARLSFQEYFERMTSKSAWGKPTAALLGALQAQIACGTAAIGGKDSMSGTFGELKVPPTLVSFAVAVTDEKNVRGGSFQAHRNLLVLVQTPLLKDNTPDWSAFHKNCDAVAKLAKTKTILAASPISSGGIAATISKMCFGNKIGAELTPEALAKIPVSPLFAQDSHSVLFAPLYGSLILEVDMSSVHPLCGIPTHLPETLLGAQESCFVIGRTLAEPIIRVGDMSIPVEDANKSWESTLSAVFPPISTKSSQEPLPQWASSLSSKYCESLLSPPIILKKTKPLVVLPVFPGTNCEYDMARAFSLSGANTRFVILRNRTKEALEESLKELQTAIDSAQILAFSGGFSAGDEPDGSGKFIANILRESSIAESTLSLLHTRKGLILGICNGFQALIKVGLVPYGAIRSPHESMPTLTYNTVGRHISRFAKTRITSRNSAWASDERLIQGKIHQIPLSHGEGRVIIEPSFAEKLFDKGQIFSQYVDDDAMPTMNEPDNPNGSMFAIEGMTDETGRVLGKMGHSERPIDIHGIGSGKHLFKNIPGESCENIFAAGVRYFN